MKKTRKANSEMNIESPKKLKKGKRGSNVENEAPKSQEIVVKKKRWPTKYYLLPKCGDVVRNLNMTDATMMTGFRATMRMCRLPIASTSNDLPTKLMIFIGGKMLQLTLTTIEVVETANQSDDRNEEITSLSQVSFGSYARMTFEVDPKADSLLFVADARTMNQYATVMAYLPSWEFILCGYVEEVFPWWRE